MSVVRGVFGQVLPESEHPQGVPLADARRLLLAAGVPVDELDKSTGFGLRSGVGCAAVDSRVRKFAAGALSIHGVMGDVFGLDSVQHHRGHALDPDKVGHLSVEACGSRYTIRYMGGRETPGFGVYEDVTTLADKPAVVAWLRCPPAWFGDPVAAVLMAQQLRYWPDRRVS